MCGIGFHLRFKKSTASFHKTLLHSFETYQELLDNQKRQKENIDPPNIEYIINQLRNTLSPRGPDGTNHIKITNENVEILLVGSLLALRGTSPILQPLIHEHHYLLWNGEIFGGKFYDPIKNDSQILLQQLIQCNTPMEVAYILANVQGPYSIIYANMDKKFIVFGRDPLGRRSLLYCNDTMSQSIILSSSAFKVPNCEWEELPVDGLYNISFDNDLSVNLMEWSSIYKNGGREILFPRKEIVPKEGDLEKIPYDKLIKPFIQTLSEAVRKRVTNIFSPSKSDQPTIGVLFSGGIDSVIITALAHLHMNSNEAIDLLNVSFGNNSADRIQSIKAVKELQSVYPERKFNLVHIDVGKDELEKHKNDIFKLIYPRCTVLDFNISAALWFASRGIGKINGEGEIYKSKARIVLSGIGSDEQLAGYGRHRTLAKKFGWKRLHDELDMDVKRLWIRNLGRDDRIISSHGRELRAPFLDETFIQFVRELPLWYIADFRDELGDKKILRLAAESIGLKNCSTFTKRAIQFGSKIAKISYKKQDGDTPIKIEL